jgi:hypothetical protein
MIKKVFIRDNFDMLLNELSRDIFLDINDKTLIITQSMDMSRRLKHNLEIKKLKGNKSIIWRTTSPSKTMYNLEEYSYYFFLSAFKENIGSIYSLITNKMHVYIYSQSIDVNDNIVLLEFIKKYFIEELI